MIFVCSLFVFALFFFFCLETIRNVFGMFLTICPSVVSVCCSSPIQNEQQETEQDHCIRGDIQSSNVTVVRLTASRRTHGHHRLEEMHFLFYLTELIDRPTHVIAVLTFLDRHHTQSGIGVLVRGGEMRYPVMLIIGQNDVVLQPYDGRWRIRLNMALQVHVILQCLAKARMWDGDDRREFHLQMDIPFVALTHAVIGHTVIRAAVLLLHRFDFKYVSDVRGTIYKIKGHKLKIADFKEV